MSHNRTAVGLASSEMTKAQYDRSYGAQLQSRAGDQWGYFQAKRLKGALQRATLDAVALTLPAPTFDEGLLKQAVVSFSAPGELARTQKEAADLLSSKEGRTLLECLSEQKLPKTAAAAPVSAPVAGVLEAIEQDLSEDEILGRLRAASDAQIAADLAAARQQVRALDESNKPVSQTLSKLETLFGRLGKAAFPKEAWDSLVAARMRHEALRYDAEAKLNQKVASILELQVRKANVSAERHHRRSQRFFFGMLAAQAGAIAATFAIATQKRNLLWGLAAGAGFVAICIAGYVYLFV